MDGSGNGYLKTVCDYVHLNPARAGLLQAAESLASFAWSSYPMYLNPARRPAWVRVDCLLGEWRSPNDREVGRRAFAEGMESRRNEEMPEEFRRVERGWCIGDDEFRRELLERVMTRPSPVHFGEAVQESGKARAERIVTEGLARLGWTELDLSGRPKGHPQKLELAVELRARTTMPVAWIADRLKMGTRGYLT